MYVDIDPDPSACSGSSTCTSIHFLMDRVQWEQKRELARREGGGRGCSQSAGKRKSHYGLNKRGSERKMRFLEEPAGGACLVRTIAQADRPDIKSAPDEKGEGIDVYYVGR